MENKKNVKQNFLQKFSNFNLKKKEMKKKGKKKGRSNLLFIITLRLMSPTTQHIFYHLCFDREISDIILILKSNISSYN